MRILLVDDEIVALNALKKRVDWVKYGFTETYLAQDAKQAREVLQAQKIDLVLCDIEMPGENGLELVEFIKSTYSETECMMVTCHADFNYLKQSMKCKAYEYILKPIDYEELASVLIQYSEERKRNENREKIEKIMERTMDSKRQEEMASLDRMDQVKQYIEEHLHEKIYVEELANIVHINEQYFMRLFKRQTGQSVTEYITERRILVGSSLLKDTDKSINFIADCVGCENYSYFTKIFKKHTGFTPSEYRARFKK